MTMAITTVATNRGAGSTTRTTIVVIGTLRLPLMLIATGATTNTFRRMDKEW